jgi:hypothetical protein
VKNLDFLVVSFYCGSDFYYKKADALKKNLSDLGIPYEIDELSLKEGDDWIDITRKKVEFIYSKIINGRSKRIVWVDVDCHFEYYPSLLMDFSADIVGFQRGFGHPANIGYASKRRFWEPCLLGFKCNKINKDFFAFMLEEIESERLKATDDYYFEEGWRRFSSSMSFQVIPSTLRVRRGQIVDDLSGSDESPFFVFGSSGNVPKYQSSAKQHDQRPKEFRQAFLPIKAVNSNNPFIRLLKKTIRLGREYRRKFLAKVESRSNEELKQNKLKLYEEVDMSLRPAIPLTWWPQPENGNFGDFLSPYIVSNLSGRSVSFVSASKARILAIGSIIKFARKDTLVWGSGVSRQDTELDPNARYLAVRGPYTRTAVLQSGGHCEAIYGDPAIILPRLYQSDKAKVLGKIGLVVHSNHKGVKFTLPDTVEQRDIEFNTPSDIEDFIDWMHSCEVILSSAMHPHIVAIAYGIRTSLITFSGFEASIPGDGVKFDDFYAGVGIESRGCFVVGKSSDFLKAAENAWSEAIPKSTVDKLIESFEVIKEF